MKGHNRDSVCPKTARSDIGKSKTASSIPGTWSRKGQKANVQKSSYWLEGGIEYQTHIHINTWIRTPPQEGEERVREKRTLGRKKDKKDWTRWYKEKLPPNSWPATLPRFYCWRSKLGLCRIPFLTVKKNAKYTNLAMCPSQWMGLRTYRFLILLYPLYSRV